MKYNRNEFGDVADYRFDLYNGYKAPYGDHVSRGEFEGYTVILKRPHSTTHLNINNKDEAWETVNNHVENYEKFVKQDADLALFLTKDENDGWRN